MAVVRLRSGMTPILVGAPRVRESNTGCGSGKRNQNKDEQLFHHVFPFSEWSDYYMATSKEAIPITMGFKNATA